MAHGPRCSTCSQYTACDGVCPTCEARRRREKIFQLQETEWEIGDPISFAAMEESYMRLKFGKIEPVCGSVHPETYYALFLLLDAAGARPGFLTMRFNAAKIVSNEDIEVGYIRWTLPWPYNSRIYDVEFPTDAVVEKDTQLELFGDRT